MYQFSLTNIWSSIRLGIEGSTISTCTTIIINNITRKVVKQENVNLRGVFSDISKVFVKVWHGGLLFKLKAYEVEGELLSLLENYLENREERVALNGHTSAWWKINFAYPMARH